MIEDTDYRTPRGLDRALFHKLATCEWIRARQLLVIGGPTGNGKSWLACALGHKACRRGLVRALSTSLTSVCRAGHGPR